MAPEELPTQRLAIHSLEGSRIIVTAMFNPKDISIDKSVPWAKQGSSRGDKPALAFWSAHARSHGPRPRRARRSRAATTDGGLTRRRQDVSRSEP